jgi:hypothetical protein
MTNFILGIREVVLWWSGQTKRLRISSSVLFIISAVIVYFIYEKILFSAIGLGIVLLTAELFISPDDS